MPPSRPQPRNVTVKALPPPVTPRWLKPVILILAAWLLVACSSSEVADTDTWWHLKTGQYMLQHHALPVPDPFAFTTYMGKPAYPGEEVTRYFNLTHEWLAQIFFYLIYAAGGYGGLVLLRAGLITAFCALIGVAAYHRTNGFYRSLGASLAAATVACKFVSDRPYLITFLFLAITLVICEYRRWFWVLPPMFLIWANCHGGFFMGWVVLGVYCGEALVERLRGKAPPDELRLWAFSLGSILISGLNPNWFRVISVMRSYRASVMQSRLYEWHYPLPWPPTPFSILLVAALIVLVWARKRTRPADWLLLAVFGTAANLAVRNIILAAFVGPLLIVAYLPWNRLMPRWAEFLIAAGLLVGAGAQTVEGQSFQFRAAEWKFSAGAADFILSHHITGPLFNTYELGGYLIWRLWPEERVFIDGRALNEAVNEDYRRIAFNADNNGGKSSEELLEQYGIEVILMDGFEFTSGSPYLLPAALSDPKQTEWKLVYQDAQAVIYMRHPPPGVQPLNSFDALGAMESQCSTYIEHDPGRPNCANGLADLFSRIGDTARARKWQALYAQYNQ